MTTWTRSGPRYHQLLVRALSYFSRPNARNPGFDLRAPHRRARGNRHRVPSLVFSAWGSGADRLEQPEGLARSTAKATSAPVDATGLGESQSTDGLDSQTPTAQTPTTADPDELHALVVEHSDAIFRLALSVVRDRSLAEDVAQDTLVKAWLALPSFRGESSLRGWVLRIAHNTAVSTLRRRRAVVLDPHDMPEQHVRTERSVESRVQSTVVMDTFVEALDLLDELSRSIVVLRELEGLAYDEIAQVLDVPMPTVKTRLLRARRRLGSALRDWE